MRRVPGPAALALVAVLAGADEWRAPESESVRANPLAATEEALAKGRALYQRHCASCHGDKGRGDGEAARFNSVPTPDLTTPAARRASDGEILWKITTGRRQGVEVIMPSVRNSVKAEEDRWKVVLYVRALTAPVSASPAP